MAEKVERLPAPHHIGKQNVVYSEFYRDENLNQAWPVGWLIVPTLLFGGLGIGLGLGVSFYFLLFILIPAFFIGSFVRFHRNSERLTIEDGNGRSIYKRAMARAQEIYDEHTWNDVRPLLENIWKHEVAMDKAKKGHFLPGYYDDGCRKCKERLDLISEFVDRQSTPGTDDGDIETARAKLEGLKEIEA